MHEVNRARFGSFLKRVLATGGAGPSGSKDGLDHATPTHKSNRSASMIAQRKPPVIDAKATSTIS